MASEASPHNHTTTTRHNTTQASDGEQFDLHNLAPDYGFALRGEWAASTGLRIEISTDGHVKGGDGSTGRLFETNARDIILRSGLYFARLANESVQGPSPEMLRWDDGSIWVRQRRRGQTRRTPETSVPQGLAPGVRVDTNYGRGTLMREHNTVDPVPYWYVRLDSAPAKERLVTSLAIRILPWFAQDARAQSRVELATDSGFEQFDEEHVYLMLRAEREEAAAKAEEARAHRPTRAHVYAPPPRDKHVVLLDV